MLMLSVPQGARAQLLQAKLSHYSTENGLPSNTIAHMDNDDYGFVWIVTWNGISRFDGYNFYNYKTGIASGVRGLHNRVDFVTVDQAQNVWLKMYDGRIFYINRKTDRIEDPLDGIAGHEEFAVDYFFVPYVTTTSDLLVSYKDIGLYKFHLDQNGLKRDLIMTGKLTANCIVEGYRNDLWVGTDQGVHRVNMSNMALERKGFFDDEHITRLASNGYNIFAGTKSGKILKFSYGEEPTLIKQIGREITGLFVDSHGTIWFSDLGDGAYRLNPETGDVKFFNQHVPSPEFTSRGAEFGESLGVVWIRMNHGGYGYYNRDADEVEYFHNDPSNPWNLCNTVNARLEMNDGVVWESTIRRGLEKLEVLKNTITRSLLIPNAESPLDNEIRGMVHDAKRNITMLANKRGKIMVFDGNMNQTGLITHDQNGQPISRPYGMSMDSKGNTWVCDKDNGLYKITPTSGGAYTVQNFRHDDNNPYSINSNAAYQAVEDKHGNIWVATYGGGVNVLRKNKDGQYIALHSKNVMKRYPQNAHKKVRTIALAQDGTVWAGSTDGILIMQIRNENIVIEQLQAPEQMEKGLMSNDIVYLARDAEGTMWVGTNSGGLSRTTKKDKKGIWQFENYGIEDGMPSEEIRSITFDKTGNVWFATDHIISSFDVKKKIFTTFSNLDGVDETMCSEGAAITLSNGNILFGTLNGYYTIDRKKLQTTHGSLLRLHLTDFYLNGKLMSPRLDSTYSYYVPEAKQVKLPSRSDAFSFRFAALNYQMQHRVHYQYMLEGYDDDWRSADKTRTATYSNLPSGKYKFQVKAFLLESPDAYDLRSIEVIVPGHFLWSPTALWIYLILLLLGLGYACWHFRHRWFARFIPTQLPVKAVADEDTKAEEKAKIVEKKEEMTDEYEIIES